MKVIGFSGSPRKNGNTDLLVQEVLAGAAAKGAKTSFYHLNTMKIRPCQADNACKTDGKCAMQDDMQKLYEEILDADTVVLGSPVYMWQMSAQTKTLVDRFYAFLNPDYSSKVAGKNLVLVFAQGNPDMALFQGYFDHTRKMLSFLGFNVKDVVVAAGVMEKGDVKGHSELMAKAKAVGANLVF